jgi:2-phospho-L-lactate transferase/gluconeogenesis factor (CofD/UPF0052 family)
MEKYAGEIIDYVFVNNGHISDEVVEKYKNEEGKKPVKLKEGMDFSEKKYTIIQRDFVNDTDLVRHSPSKIATVIEEMLEGKI